MKIAIVGAGIVGLGLARELRRRGEQVLLLDAATPGKGATWAAAGILGPSAETQTPGSFFELCRAAAAFYPDYVRELEEETGLPVEYRTEGTLCLYHSAEQRDELEQRFAWQRERGVPSMHLDAAEVRVLEPEARAPGGYLLPGDAQVDNRLLAGALIEACGAAGVAFQHGRAESVITEGGRAVGVVVEGKPIRADTVVNAAGAWSGSISVPGVSVPIRPVKGQMLALALPQPFLQHVLHDPSVYLVPRKSGRVVVGSTMEDAGYDISVSDAAIEKLRAAAVALVPKLAHSSIAEQWAGLRPAAPDGLPRLGRTSLPGYFLATGHFRNGILLGPITARLLASVVLGNPPDPLIAPFQP